MIRLPYYFEGQRDAEFKYFVVIGHKADHAICIKATSKTTIYESNREMMVGCVYYRGGELGCFTENTAIQPDNQIPIPHDTLASEEREERLQMWQLPGDFKQKLAAAIANSTTLSRRQKERLTALLDL